MCRQLHSTGHIGFVGSHVWQYLISHAATAACFPVKYIDRVSLSQFDTRGEDGPCPPPCLGGGRLVGAHIGRRLQLTLQILVLIIRPITHFVPLPVGNGEKGVAKQPQMVLLDQGRARWRTA